MVDNFVLLVTSKESECSAAVIVHATNSCSHMKANKGGQINPPLIYPLNLVSLSFLSLHCADAVSFGFANNIIEPKALEYKFLVNIRDTVQWNVQIVAREFQKHFNLRVSV